MPRDKMRPKRSRLEHRICFRVASCSLRVLATVFSAASILFGRLRLKWLRRLKVARCEPPCSLGTRFLAGEIQYGTRALTPLRAISQAPLAIQPREESVTLLD